MEDQSGVPRLVQQYFISPNGMKLLRQECNENSDVATNEQRQKYEVIADLPSRFDPPHTGYLIDQQDRKYNVDYDP